MYFFKHKIIFSTFFLLLFSISLILLGINPGFTIKTQTMLPPIPEASTFLNAIDEEIYHTVEQPENAELLKWNFSVRKNYAYKYSKISITSEYSSRSQDHSGDYPITTRSDGKLILESQGDKTADLILKDIETIIQKEVVKEVGEPKTLKIQTPPLIIQGVQENGEMDVGLNSHELILKILFPLPPKALKIGEYADVDESILFNANGVPLTVSGRSKIYLARYVEINDHTCARLEATIDISNIEKTNELIGKYKSSTRGKSVFYFDIEERCIVTGSAAIMVSMRIDAPTSLIKTKVNKGTSHIQGNIRMAVDNDNLISLSLIKGEREM